ncbi:Hint domain-containing protein [uncultured Tateyamaria sp.]|uniref:Hint domain-containing protein n=1 Tax=uncultured Tateyamaria sp. TaxID=455651 RepID=UPI00261A5D0D|nr:Hint domain-containing protein [uncultured Tateyamaria sp.]
MAIFNEQTIAGNYDPGASTLPFTAVIVTMQINDADDDGVIRADGGDQINGSNVTAVWVGDTVTIDGGTPISGVTFYTADGSRYFTPDDGTVLVDGTVTAQTFVNTSTQFPIGGFGPPCFVAGTRIAVPGGHVRVEDLSIGDYVETRDRGPQRIRWIGTRTVAGRGAFAPVRILSGAIGNHDTLTVSPQHRILIDDWRAQMYFGDNEVLVAAHMLVDGDMVRHVPCARVRYVHFMFEDHQIVTANGLACESFLFGDYLCHPTSPLRADIVARFPEFGTDGPDMQAARRVLRGHEAQVLHRVPSMPLAIAC